MLSGKWDAVLGMVCCDNDGWVDSWTLLRVAGLPCSVVVLSSSQLLRLIGGRAMRVQRLLGRGHLLGLVGSRACRGQRLLKGLVAVHKGCV